MLVCVTAEDLVYKLLAVELVEDYHSSEKKTGKICLAAAVIVKISVYYWGCVVFGHLSPLQFKYTEDKLPRHVYIHIAQGLQSALYCVLTCIKT